MPSSQHVYVVIGPHANQDAVWAGHEFHKGVAEVVVNDERLVEFDRLLAHNQAYRHGDPLRAAVLALMTAHPSRTDLLPQALADDWQAYVNEGVAHAATQVEIDSGDAVQDGGAGSEVQDSGSAASDAEQRGHGQPEEGNAESEAAFSDGTGSTDPVNEDGSVNAEGMGLNPVALAVLRLDPAADDHWTSGGLPKVDVVASFLGKATTRAEVEAAVPDYTRAVALEKKSGGTAQ